jgi:hypothetical protein
VCCITKFDVQLAKFLSFSYFSRILGNQDVFGGNFCCDSCAHNIHATKIDEINFYKFAGSTAALLTVSKSSENRFLCRKPQWMLGCFYVFAAHFIIFSKKLIRQWPAGK